MLDQNTDRMWFVIGAVIVGAAIIFIANGTIPEIFASVTDSFEASSAKALDVVDDLEPNTSKNLLYGVTLYDGWVKSEREVAKGLYVDTPEGHIRVFRTKAHNLSTHKHTDYIRVKPNTTYVFYGEDGLYAPRVGFYNESRDVVGSTFNSIDASNTWGDIDEGAIPLSIFTTPGQAAYIRISAENTEYSIAQYDEARGTHWSDWVLMELEDFEEQGGE